MADKKKKTITLIAFVVYASFYLGATSFLVGQGQMQSSAQGNVPLSKWRPTRELPGVGYIGARACAQCHTNRAEHFFTTPMAHALESVSDCDILIKRPRLTFSEGAYSYKITRQGNRSIYTVSDGTNTISEPILYCFGQGVAGQTYVLQHKGALYEGRVSYFQELRSLNITILHPRSVPTSLENALGRLMSPEGARGCFSCHSTAAIRGSELQLDRLVPGVSCEACHGPGEKHLAAVKAKNFKDLQIFNPRNLDPFDLTQEFCGACHMNFEQAIAMPDHGGINNLRFQPYRIFSSQSHFKDDPRISCTACHDPHDHLEHEASFYDSKCLACHLSDSKEAKTETRSASACPVSKQLCVTCHMPKVEVPEMHFKFTDHWIRIVKSGEGVPR
jgi:hypothetical protein